MNELDFMKLAELFADKPLIIYLSLFLFTFVLEDVATVSAALLSSYGHIMPEFAYIALLTGIILGDLGLYGLGYGASHMKWAKRLLERKGVKLANQWLDRREIIAVIGARFVPGARLPTYTAMGFFKLSFTKFMVTVFFASVLWTLLLFTAVCAIGEIFVDQLDIYRWPMAIFMLLLILVLPRFVEYCANRKKKYDSA
jgi:membrane protein DedA with SNARE-associated domain